MHSDARMISSIRPPAPIAMPAIVVGLRFVASGLTSTASPLLTALVALALWLFSADALASGVVKVLNVGVLVVSSVVSALNVVVALKIGVEEDDEISAVLVNVKSVVTVLRSELVVPKSVEAVEVVIVDSVPVVEAEVSAVEVAMLGDKTGS